MYVFFVCGYMFLGSFNRIKIRSNFFSDTFECSEIRLMLILILDNIDGSRTYQVYSGYRLPMVLERKIAKGTHVRLLFYFPQAADSYLL